MNDNVSKVLKSLSAEDRAELAKALIESAPKPKEAKAKAVEYEYGKVGVFVEVRPKGTKGEYQHREVVAQPMAKASLNHNKFEMPKDCGVLLGRNKIYVPISNVMKQGKQSS